MTDEREVDYHRVGRIRSEFAAGWKMKGVIFDKKEYRCKGMWANECEVDYKHMGKAFTKGK